jgi:hypothetical protein
MDILARLVFSNNFHTTHNSSYNDNVANIISNNAAQNIVNSNDPNRVENLKNLKFSFYRRLYIGMIIIFIIMTIIGQILAVGLPSFGISSFLSIFAFAFYYKILDTWFDFKILII